MRRFLTGVYFHKSILAMIVPALAFTNIACNSPSSKTSSKTPNIVLIYVDDLGYGDVSCYGAKKVSTPNVDFLATNGLLFTDAHCAAATCTPSRYSLLTGRYAFRNRAAILPGDAPLLIDPSTITLPAVLKHAGYTTAVIGKWHLGLGRGSINWNEKISPGPNEIGFDYAFIIPATTDRVPTVYVENGRVPNLDPTDPIQVSYQAQVSDEPTGLEHPELLKMAADPQHSNTVTNGISRIGYMAGGTKARWVDEEIADVLTARAREFMESNRTRPFFLYFSIPDIHVPRAPHPRFVGATTMGRRGDVIVEMDWMTGEITKTLERLGLKENTLIIFSSDNGPVLNDGYEDNAEQLNGDHNPSGPYRGGKYSAYEAGTRVPTVVYWPGHVKAGRSEAVLSQVDWLASLAALTGNSLENTQPLDSRNTLDVLLGKSKEGREMLLEESFTFSLREGKWKYIAPSAEVPPTWLSNKKIEAGLMAKPQLYDLEKDPKEQKNLATQYPEIVSRLEENLNDIKKPTNAEISK